MDACEGDYYTGVVLAVVYYVDVAVAPCPRVGACGVGEGAQYDMWLTNGIMASGDIFNKLLLN